MISDVIAPYESVDFGPPLSDWERSDAALTDRFREEFPDGIVPIRHVPKMGTRTSDPVKWAFRLLAAYDAAQGSVRSVDECARLREEFRETYGNHYDDVGGEQTQMSRLQARRAAVRALLYQGLTIRQVARYLNTTATDIGRMVFTQVPNDQPFPTTLLDMDEAVLEWLDQGRPTSAAQLARDVEGATTERVLALIRLRTQGSLYKKKGVE